MKIEKPGIYRDIDVAAYHNDPCPQPSLSQSIAKILIDRSPLHAAVAHPRITRPEQDDDETEKYVKAQVIGDAAHALLIERGKSLAVANYDDWRKKEAAAFKAAAIAAGKTPILAKHLRQAEEIASAARVQLSRHEEIDCFLHGAGEVALVWREGDIWFRCLVDWLHDNLLTSDDFKTTGMSVAAHVLGLRAADAGWHIQAAMIERGLDALDPRNAGRRKFRFVAQEQDAPHALNVMKMTEHWLTMGRKQLQHGVDLWTRCIRSGEWPSYLPVAVTPEFPGWKESKWLEREIAHHEAGADRVTPMLRSLAGG